MQPIRRQEQFGAGSGAEILGPLGSQWGRWRQVDHQQSCELAVAFRSAVPVDDVCAALDGETRWKHEPRGHGGNFCGSG